MVALFFRVYDDCCLGFCDVYVYVFSFYAWQLGYDGYFVVLFEDINERLWLFFFDFSYLSLGKGSVWFDVAEFFDDWFSVGSDGHGEAVYVGSLSGYVFVSFRS